MSVSVVTASCLVSNIKFSFGTQSYRHRCKMQCKWAMTKDIYRDQSESNLSGDGFVPPGIMCFCFGGLGVGAAANHRFYFFLSLNLHVLTLLRT